MALDIKHIDYPARVQSGNINSTAATRAIEAAGHRQVKELADLLTISDFVLSDSGDNTDNDALGQEWYVQEDGKLHQLISWENRKKAEGWITKPDTSDLNQAIADETKARQDADKALDAKIVAETNRATTAETTLQNNIDALDQITAKSTDGRLVWTDGVNYVGSNPSLRGGIETLDSKVKEHDDAIKKEVTDRTEADTILQTNISNNANAIKAETDRATAKENDLQQQIDANNASDTDLKNVVYTNHFTAAINANPNIIYKGEDTNVTISWSSALKGATDFNPTYVVNKNGTQWTDTGTSKQETINTNATYAVVATFDGFTANASVTINSYYPVYTFSSVDSVTALPSDAVKQAVTSTPVGKTYNYTVADSAKYLYIAMPTGMSISDATSGGYSVGMQAQADIQVTGKGTYKVYRTNLRQNVGTYNLLFK